MSKQEDTQWIDEVLKPLKQNVADWIESELQGTSYAKQAYEDLEAQVSEAKQAILSHIGEVEAKAEERMGEAIIERMRQSNYQWEKAESLIQSYQMQKVENVHNLKALQPTNRPEEE